MYALRAGSASGITAILAEAPFDTVMGNLRSAGWELSVDNEFTGHEPGTYQVKIEKAAVYQIPESTDVYQYFVVRLSPMDVLEDTQYRFEVMGADLMRIIRPMNDLHIHLVFRVPKAVQGTLANQG